METKVTRTPIDKQTSSVTDKAVAIGEIIALPK